MLKDTLLKVFKLDGLVNSVSGYVEARLELVKYELKEDMARGVAGISILMLIALLMFLFFLFVSFSIAFVLAQYVGTTIAFALVGAFYFLLTIGILIFKKPIKHKIEQQIKESINKKSHDLAD